MVAYVDGEPLASASDLVGYPGGPFTEDAVKAAGEAIRGHAGWHIAPTREEVEYVDSHGGAHIYLTTLQLGEVTAVSHADTDAPIAGFTAHPTARYRGGVLTRPGGWPVGVLKVEYSHGYPSVPADLVAVLAAVAQAQRVNHGQGSVRLGSLSVNNPTSDSSSTGVVSAGSVVDRYRIPALP